MSTIDGNSILAKALRRHGTDMLFFIMGGPMIECEAECEREGIRLIDVRHEQAAAMMATAYARIRRAPAVCMACSGPGVANLTAGIANAWADGAPVVAIGGASPLSLNNTLAFQELDQVALFEPITKWADRCYDTARIPEYVDLAFRTAMSGKPGPVYLDLPGDVLYRSVQESEVRWVEPRAEPLRPRADPAQIESAIEILRAAERPVIIYGSGVHWSNADAALGEFVDTTGIPFYATPQGRGSVSEFHELSFIAARGAAFRECDAIVQIGTRQNYVVAHLGGKRWNAEAALIQVEIDPIEMSRNRRADAALLGDARSVLEQLTEAASGGDAQRYRPWIERLRREHLAKIAAAEAALTDDSPIHPLRLCKAVRDALPAGAALAVDGQEILNFARQSIPFRTPHSINSGPFGMMGVGLPLGIGAKLALPDDPVVVLHGDGSFGMNAMEMDTAVRHNIPIVCVISNNGGWTADDVVKPGRDLGYTPFDEMFAPLGIHTEKITDAARLAPALEEAIAAGRPALLNVITDSKARASYAPFTDYTT